MDRVERRGAAGRNAQDIRSRMTADERQAISRLLDLSGETAAIEAQYEFRIILRASRNFLGYVEAVLHDGTFASTIEHFLRDTLPHYSSPESNSDTNTYGVVLSPAGEHLFSRRVGMSEFASVAATTTRIVFAGEIRTQFNYPVLQILDGSGGVIAEALEPELGITGRGFGAVVAASGRIYWSYAPDWPNRLATWPYLLAVSPR